jgi:hypothetical protein
MSKDEEGEMSESDTPLLLPRQRDESSLAQA